MCPQFPQQVLTLVVLASAAAVGCSDSDEAANPLRPSALQAASITAEPSTVTPEITTSQSCATGSPFGVRIVITVGDGGVIVRRLRFTLLDRSGGTSLPIAVSPLASSSISAPTRSTPVPVPGSLVSPSSFPVAVPSGSSGVFPFFVEFDCGTPTVGTLVATVDTEDGKGRKKTSEARIQVGR